jgi:UDP-N-acetylglucosamine--N-acetylmuramyl-(pentapeptide) pyrophosphoryl-undecaprenol N-acetylglucosamine transferase
MRVCIATGGTGGHIYPAISFARALLATYDDVEILFIGNSDRMEAQEIPALGFQFIGLEAKGFNGSLFAKVNAAIKTLKCRSQALKLLKEYQPDFVIGFGGYITVPVLSAAHAIKIKTMLHEQNSYAGKANRALAPSVDAIVTCYAENIGQFPRNKTFLLGNPRTFELKHIVPEPNLLLDYGLQPEIPTVLIVMGSLGSESVNRVMVEVLQNLRNKDFQVIYVTGKKHYAEFAAKVEDDDTIKIVPYVDQLNLMNHIDLIVCRGGATTAAEITAVGVPSVIIPSPFVPNNHQVLNAKSLADSGAALMIEESDLNTQEMVKTIIELIANRDRLKIMADHAKRLGKPDAANQMILLMEEILKGN